MRKASLFAFLAGMLLYPIALYLTGQALGVLLTHGGSQLKSIDVRWDIARTLSVVSVALFVVSVVLAFLAPPSRTRKRMWWAVPASVVAIVIVYFDWLGFGFAR